MYPIGTRFTTHDLPPEEFWEQAMDGYTHFIKEGKSVYKNKYTDQSWIDLEYPIHYPKEDLFTKLYLTLKQ